MPLNLAQKLITAHLVDGSLRASTPITLKIDQTLTQDATGTLVMLTLEALRLDRVRTEVSVQYVDHNLLQIDNLNADDHLFLESACRGPSNSMVRIPETKMRARIGDVRLCAKSGHLD